MGLDSAGQIVQAVPWAWYFARAGGLVAFLLLYFSIFFGLAIRLPILKKIIAPGDSFSLHRTLSAQVFIFVLLHGLFFLGDIYLNFGLKEIFVPFASTFEPQLVAMGVIGMYLMLILLITSYFRRFISYRAWRAVHFLNIALYGAGFFHAYYLGTDLKSGLIREIFLGMNILLFGLMIASLLLKLKNTFTSKSNANLS
ncbi:MAG: ferric reductase-like transmembrane domain-containing protein [Candidatus Moraniibacteriota bacterium]